MTPNKVNVLFYIAIHVTDRYRQRESKALDWLDSSWLKEDWLQSVIGVVRVIHILQNEHFNCGEHVDRLFYSSNWHN